MATQYRERVRRHASPAASVVLLVEPKDDNRDMFAEYLQACGLTVLTADTTDDGLIRAANADVIVTGIRMPGSCDGIEFVRRLRNADGTKEKPIIVLTACALESDQRRALSAGCDTFLAKPCLPDRLESDVRAALARPKARLRQTGT